MGNAADVAEESGEFFAAELAIAFVSPMVAQCVSMAEFIGLI
jgi:hypothetical protein